MSRTTRTERSASWKTSAGAGVSSTRFWSTSCSLCRYCSSRSKSARLAPCAAVRMIAPPPLQVELLRLLAQAVALLVVEAARHADALAGGRVDHVAAGDRQLHRQPRALGLQRVLDDLHDDLLAGLEQVGDLRCRPCRRRGRAAASRRPAARSRRRAGSRSSRGRCRRTRPRGRRGRCRPGPCRCCRRSSGRRGARGRARRRGSRALGSLAARRAPPWTPGYPVASSSATRVSPRSTLTSTCFLHW